MGAQSSRVSSALLGFARLFTSAVKTRDGLSVDDGWKNEFTFDVTTVLTFAPITKSSNTLVSCF